LLLWLSFSGCQINIDIVACDGVGKIDPDIIDMEFFNHDNFVGYDYAVKEFIYWFWHTVNEGKKAGCMQPEIEKIRNWIIDHRDNKVEDIEFHFDKESSETRMKEKFGKFNIIDENKKI
jgi:hypothetical protein